jgi:membrane-bound lytic murein transglycosylase B
VHLRAILIIAAAALATTSTGLTARPSGPDVQGEPRSGGSAEPAPAQEAPADPKLEFSVWLRELVDEARRRGFSDDLVAQTLSGLEPLPRVIESDRNQAELNPGFARYLSSRLTPAMIRNGRTMARQHATLLGRIEKAYGVPRRFLLAIWGIESRYGKLMGRTPEFQALATLAWEPRRAEFFRGELFNALMMVDRGYIDARTMTGSWAGAMGQTQFMPSSYLQYAVDFDRNGHRDIWKSTPDALASIANYLKGYGWVAGEAWGREVRVPDDALAIIRDTIPKRAEGCYAIRNMTERLPLSRWTALGVVSIDGRPLPASEMAAGLVDVGERRFLVYANYDAILGYNCAHYYALSAVLLGEEIANTKPARTVRAPARKAKSQSRKPKAPSPKPTSQRRPR